MTNSTAQLQHDLTYMPEQRNMPVELARPFLWIKKGIADFFRAPMLSMLYGFLFAIACAGVYALISNVPWFPLAFLTGLVFLGPFLAAGLYAASRDMESGNKLSVVGSLRLIYRRRTYLALFSLMLTLVMAAWIRFTALVFAITFTNLSPSMNAYFNLFTSSEGMVLLGFFVAAGLLLSASVFTISAVAIPYILDKDVDFISAMGQSFKTVTGNPAAMAVWAVSIVLLTALGIATAFVAFLVIFPVLGYATWHSYKDLVR